MFRPILTICLLLFAWRAMAQQTPMWSNRGTVSVRDGALLSIHGDAYNAPGALHDNSDTVALFDDWTNDGGNSGFAVQPSGLVRLLGDTQRISGTDVTRFWDLRLEGSGVKFADLDVEIGDSLQLNDREFSLGTFTAKVLSPATGCVTTGLNGAFGFVSSITNGGLQRATDQAAPYVFPVGSSTGPVRFRPVELTPATASPNDYKVRMAHVDASTENFDRNVRQNTICKINPYFYHRIRRMAGSDGFRLRTYYDPVLDSSIWNGTAHWQNQPQWEKIEPNTTGTDPFFTLSFVETVPTVTNLGFPAFALANISDSIALTATANPSCPGDTVTYTAESGFVQYQFFVNGVLVQNSADSTYTAVFQSGDVVEVTAFDFDCVAYGFPDTMVLYQNSVSLAANPNPACFYDVVTVSATPGFLNYLFTVNGDTVQNGPNAQYLSDSLSTGDLVLVVGTDSVCDWTSNPVSITIHSNFIALSSNRDSVCTDSSATFTATPGFYQYDFQINGLTVQNGPSNVLTFAPFQNGDSVVVIGYDSLCYYPSHAVFVYLYTNTISMMGLPDTVCAGETVTFTATPGFLDYHFYVDGITAQAGADSIFAADFFQNGDEVFVVGTDAHCPYFSNLDTVHLYQNSIFLAAGATTVCSYDTVDFTATPGFLEYAFAVNGQVVQNGPSNQFSYAGFQNGDSVQVIGTDIHCPFGSNFVVISLFQNNITLTATDTFLCAGESSTFTASTGFDNYAFYVNGVLVQNGLSNLFVLDSINDGDSVQVLGTDPNCTYTSQAIELTVYQNPVSLTAPLLAVCAGETVEFSTTPGFESYAYYQNGQLVHLDSMPDWEAVHFDNGDLFYVTAFDGLCTYTSDSLTITEFDTVWVDAVGDTSIYRGLSHPLGTFTSLNVISYSWSPGAGLSCVSCPDPVASPAVTTVYTVSVESSDGCVATDTVAIRVLDPNDAVFVFPNCITPNGDGANDTWILDVISLFDNHEVIIINRWGSEVFRSTDYQNDFDGTWEGGLLPAGTYYYIIRLNTDQIYKGPFVIIRE